MKKKLRFYTMILVVTIPIVIVGAYLSVVNYKNQTSDSMTRGQAAAYIGAELISEKLNKIVDIGKSLAGRPSIILNAENGEWQKIIDNLANISTIFPDIDNVILLDKDGIVMETFPNIPGFQGTNLAYRDFYKGISKDWKPYVSEVIIRLVEPKYSIIPVVVPIKNQYDKILGILEFNIKSSTITSWTNNIEFDKGTIIYIVDKNGNLVSHPGVNLDNNLVSYVSVPTVQKLLRGETGIEVNYNVIDKEERIVAFTPVKNYGFGLVVAQPSKIGFADRDGQLYQSIIIWTIVILGIIFISIKIEKRERKNNIQQNFNNIVLESIGDAIIVINRDWKITKWNNISTVLSGWKEEDVLGKPFRDIVKFIRESDRKEDINFIEDAIVMKRTSYMEIGTILIKKDGSEIYVGDCASPIINEEGNTEGAVIVFHDATREHEAKRLRSDFSYTAHQIRTPVTEALWNLEIAIDEPDADKKKEDLNIAYQSLQSVKMLSEHIVVVSEVDQGSVYANLAPIKFIDVLTTVKSNLEDLIKKHNVTLSIDAISPLMAINTDKKILGDALTEIIGNAVIYSHKDGEVKIETMLKDDEIVIKIIDNGVGIPNLEKALIFTKFFRGSNRGLENPGSGLGTHIAKAYITLLGGKIWFDSEEGKGTTFYISLPIV